MKFHDFSPFYRSGEGIRSKVSGDRLIDNPAVADAQGGSDASYSFDGTDDYVGIGHDDNLKPTHSITVSAWANAVDWTDTTSRRIFSNTQNVANVQNKKKKKVKYVLKLGSNIIFNFRNFIYISS